MTLPCARKILAVAVLSLMAGVALSSLAQAQRYPSSRDSRHGAAQPGVFDYYALVLSWSPTYCANLRRGQYDPQCDKRNARPYAFVLHGLWPQHEKGWPQYCRTRQKPFVPRALIDAMLDIMPSSRLIIHEYKKHGTCSGLGPRGYYALARQIYGSLVIPQRYRRVAKAMTVRREGLIEDFLQANPSLERNMIAVSCGGPGNRLREVRICFSRNGRPTPCGRNEAQRRLCRADRMYVPPMRLSAGVPAAGRRSKPQRRQQPPANDWLPGPGGRRH